MNKKVLQMGALTVLMGVMQAQAASITTIYDHDFNAGDTGGLNGVTLGAEDWVAAPGFNANGSFNDVAAGFCGTATLAFNPVDGLVYTLDASFNLTAGGGDWLGFGFVNGQSTSNSKTVNGDGENRFIEQNTTGIAWMLVKQDDSAQEGLLGNTALPSNGGLAATTDWAGEATAASPMDLRIVLDTTGGTGNWTATWYAKQDTDADYAKVVATSNLLDEDITSVGFGVGDGSLDGSISTFSLTSIPEPSSYALLAGCFGLTWVMLRRRR